MSGAQCVTTPGILLTLKLPVETWDSLAEVRTMVWPALAHNYGTSEASAKN